MFFCKAWLALVAVMDWFGGAAKILDQVPLRHQETDYSCGASVTAAEAALYGHYFSEAALREFLGTDEIGTDARQIVTFMTGLGVPMKIVVQRTIDELAEDVADGRPPIVAVQAWPADPAAPPEDYELVWELGHYVIVIGVDEENVYVMDPWLIGRRGYFPRKDFERRWHDWGREGARYDRMAIVPQVPSPYRPRDVWARWARIP